MGEKITLRAVFWAFNFYKRLMINIIREFVNVWLR